jgi:hypothetical protein
MRSLVEEGAPGPIAWPGGPEDDCVVGSTLFLDGGLLLYPNFV